MIFIYLTVGLLDYYIYLLINIPVNPKEMVELKQTYNSATGATKTTTTNNLDSLIYYIFACEFIFLLLKLVSKYIKMIVDLTQINMNKQWNKKLIVFNIISFLRYALKLLIEIVNT